MSASALRYGDRQRLFAWTLLFLLLSGAVAVFVVHQVMLLTLEQRVHTQLQEGAAAFQDIVADTGADSTDELGEALARFRSQAAPTPQAGFAFANGARVTPDGDDPFAVPASQQDRWAALTGPAQGAVATPAGRVDYLALPIQEAESPSTGGVFVVAVLTGPDRDALRQTVSLVGVGLLVVFAAASVVLWWVLHRGLGRTGAAAADTSRELEPSQAGPEEPSDAVRASEPAGAPQHPGGPPARTARAPAPRGDGEEPADDRRVAAMTVTDAAHGHRVIDVTDEPVPQPPVTPRTAPRSPVLAGDRVELGRLVVDVYGRAQRLADRDWIMDIPPDAVVRCDQASMVDALVHVMADAAARTRTGDLIHLGTAVHGRRAEVSVTTHPRDGATAPRPFHGTPERLGELQVALAAQGGDVEVDGPATVRLLLATA